MKNNKLSIYVILAVAILMVYAVAHVKQLAMSLEKSFSDMKQGNHAQISKDLSANHSLLESELIQSELLTRSLLDDYIKQADAIQNDCIIGLNSKIDLLVAREQQSQDQLREDANMQLQILQDQQNTKMNALEENVQQMIEQTMALAEKSAEAQAAHALELLNRDYLPRMRQFAKSNTAIQGELFSAATKCSAIYSTYLLKVNELINNKYERLFSNATERAANEESLLAEGLSKMGFQSKKEKAQIEIQRIMNEVSKNLGADLTTLGEEYALELRASTAGLAMNLGATEYEKDTVIVENSVDAVDELLMQTKEHYQTTALGLEAASAPLADISLDVLAREAIWTVSVQGGLLTLGAIGIPGAAALGSIGGPIGIAISVAGSTLLCALNIGSKLEDNTENNLRAAQLELRKLLQLLSVNKGKLMLDLEVSKQSLIAQSSVQVVINETLAGQE
ncbi:MAG: hypothetical protein HN405_05030 [Planctomycetes bacterium]|jgi:hypothetical protein|nr:hypothetical protein [Planctomycetota bacterium]MBT4028992.1 hypothetical protein [Planctomycetota bacterium]MBT4560260.1 hypothetical protein [Planctomycetota bacterium]